MNRRIELIFGIAVSVLAAAAMLAVVFASPITVETCSAIEVNGELMEEGCTTDRERVWGDDDWVAIAVAAAIALGMAVTATLGAWLHVKRGRALGKGLLVAASAALTLMTLIALLSIGLFFVPATLAAIISSFAAMRASPRPAT